MAKKGGSFPDIAALLACGFNEETARKPVAGVYLVLANERGTIRDSHFTKQDGSFEFFAGPETYTISYRFQDGPKIETLTIPEDCKELEVNLHRDDIESMMVKFMKSLDE